MEGDFAETYTDSEVESPTSSPRSTSALPTEATCSCSNSTRKESESEESRVGPDMGTPKSETETTDDNDCQCGKMAETTEETDLTVDNNDFNFVKSYGTRPRPILLSSDDDGKKPKLRTSKDIYDRLKWDSGSILIKDAQGEEKVVDTSDIYVGYKDRFLGMCELELDEFEPGGEIPFHRVYYFRTGGPPVEPFVGKDGEVKVSDHNLPKESVFIWDRDSRTDLVFKSGNSVYLKH